MLSPFLPSFPFSLQFVLSAQDALQQQRLLCARLICLLAGARLWFGLQKRPESLGSATARMTCWSGRSSPRDAPSRGAQVAEQVFTPLPLRGPCGRGDLRDALPVASSRRVALDCPRRKVAREKGRGYFGARRTEGPSSSDPWQAPGLGKPQAQPGAGL